MSSETAKPATKPGTKTPEPVILPDNAFIFDAGSMDTATPTIRGYASANTDVIVTVEGQTYATVSDQRGSWAIDIDSPLPQGEVVVAARAETPQGDMYFAYRININAEAVIE
ncbi:MAG: hypothetical protein OIF35_06380, partial [Cellvibrionaceae bacterium]|nr:hypothetical protein [Cellvibrionaceae bacterium]